MTTRCPHASMCSARSRLATIVPWLRTTGVNATGAAAKVWTFDRLGENVRPGTFGKIKVGQREYPKGPSVKQHEVCSDPISADPIRPVSDCRSGRGRRGPGRSRRPRGARRSRLLINALLNTYITDKSHMQHMSY